MDRLDADLSGPPALGADVGVRGGIVADEDGGQRDGLPSGVQPGDLGRGFLEHRRGHGLSVQSRGGHRISLAMSACKQKRRERDSLPRDLRPDRASVGTITGETSRHRYARRISRSREMGSCPGRWNRGLRVRCANAMLRLECWRARRPPRAREPALRRWSPWRRSEHRRS